METISRCVAAHHHAFNAGDADTCLDIAENIGRYAHTLRQMVHDDDCLTFVNLLHTWIENRAVNIALGSTIDKAFGHDPFWRHLNDADREAAADYLDSRQKAVRVQSDDLCAAMKGLRADAGGLPLPFMRDML